MYFLMFLAPMLLQAITSVFANFFIFFAFFCNQDTPLEGLIFYYFLLNTLRNKRGRGRNVSEILTRKIDNQEQDTFSKYFHCSGSLLQQVIHQDVFWECPGSDPHC